MLRIAVLGIRTLDMMETNNMDKILGKSFAPIDSDGGGSVFDSSLVVLGDRKEVIE